MGLVSVARRYLSTPIDALVQGANALLLIAVLWAHRTLPHAAAYAACHVLFALGLYLLSRPVDVATARFDPLSFFHSWLPALVVVLMYFELGVLIPLLRDYSDLRYDRALQAVDVWLLGDPARVVERYASRGLSDVLTVCYFAYYPLALLVPAALYMRGAKRDFQRAAAIIMLGFLLSYLGYFAFPALGPHRVFDARRPAALDGLFWARAGYEWLLSVPHEPPDAFPSGHALIALLVPALCWRWSRALVYYTTPVAVGIVLATVYLRLHYVTDVAAAIVLAPLCYALGCALTRSLAN